MGAPHTNSKESFEVDNKGTNCTSDASRVEVDIVGVGSQFRVFSRGSELESSHKARRAEVV